MSLWVAIVVAESSPPPLFSKLGIKLTYGILNECDGRAG